MSALLGAALLTVGVIELVHPHVPEAYLTRNTLICIAVCGLGVAALWVAASVLRRLLIQKPRGG